MNKFQNFLKSVDAFLGGGKFDGTETEDEATAKIEAMQKSSSNDIQDLKAKVDALSGLDAKITEVEGKIPTDASAELSTLKTELAETKTALQTSNDIITAIKAELKTVQEALGKETPKTQTTELKIAETVSDVEDLPETASKWS